MANNVALAAEKRYGIEFRFRADFLTAISSNGIHNFDCRNFVGKGVVIVHGFGNLFA